jgi:hypothetical protein
MFSIKELQKKINNKITSEKIGREPFSLYDPINYTLEAGGKE